MFSSNSRRPLNETLALFRRVLITRRLIAFPSTSTNVYSTTNAATKTREPPPGSTSQGAMRVLDNIIRPVKVNTDVFSETVGQHEAEQSVNVGEELSGVKLEKPVVARFLTEFARRVPVHHLAIEHGISAKLFRASHNSWMSLCMTAPQLPPDLHVTLGDLSAGKGHVDDLFPHFLRHARRVFPHLECIHDLRAISDLSDPASWYPVARQIKRKIVFHAGPTNSGKTYQALSRFMNSASGVYCGPLKLLAVEVFHKCNTHGTPCDLVTGEERKYAINAEEPAPHIACTVEMLNTGTPYEVAVIDEIQMVRDHQRGWAWTRAFLGVAAQEIHLCGEIASLAIIRDICERIGEELEVHEYQRLTPLTVLKEPLKSYTNVRDGDCIVCFNKNHIFSVSREIEKQDREVAVIYGSLPPGTKLAQAARFNDPTDPCNILVATDAIGMGLNLSIKRVIFNSVRKPQMAETGEKSVELLTVSQALQIGGRAGRYGTHYADGEVTSLTNADLGDLSELMLGKPDAIERCGLFPTFEQIELFSHHLPKATLANLLDIFVALCSVDDSGYFLCNVDDMKQLADQIEHVRDLSLRERYVFCLSPINLRATLVCTNFVKFVRRYSSGQPLTFDWLSDILNLPLQAPTTISHLVQLEQIFDVFDLYLWLSYRFVDMFPHQEAVRAAQQELDKMIQEGVKTVTNLIADEIQKDDGRGDRRKGGASSTKLVAVEARRRAKARQEADTVLSAEQKAKQLLSLSVSSKRRGMGSGKIASKMVESGAISSDVMQQLRQEILLEAGAKQTNAKNKRKKRK